MEDEFKIIEIEDKNLTKIEDGDLITFESNNKEYAGYFYKVKHLKFINGDFSIRLVKSHSFWVEGLGFDKNYISNVKIIKKNE